MDKVNPSPCKTVVPNTNSNNSAVEKTNPQIENTKKADNLPAVERAVIDQPINDNVSSFPDKEQINPSIVAQSGSTAGSSKIPKVTKTKTTKKTDEPQVQAIPERAMTRSRRKAELGNQDFAALGQKKNVVAAIPFGSKAAFAKEVRDVVSSTGAVHEEDEVSTAQKQQTEAQSEDTVDGVKITEESKKPDNKFRVLKSFWENFSSNSSNLSVEGPLVAKSSVKNNSITEKQ